VAVRMKGRSTRSSGDGTVGILDEIDYRSRL
jgi:hypothetical protein